MDVIARPLSLHTTGDAGGGIDAVSFRPRGPDRRQARTDSQYDGAAKFADEGMERAFHMSGVVAYLEYYRL
ncbi:MAG: hypothetical protein A3H35_20345 [Betaproteobacteria bacterium RIFCSPLOWO2_02_FULL_62_17]|nr:MAG: hypothetical protein A3H35_20345 [Betaproteobacteria bacterium RIFCSPLOWO2_02_FULL_62_17]